MKIKTLIFIIRKKKLTVNYVGVLFIQRKKEKKQQQ